MATTKTICQLLALLVMSCDLFVPIAVARSHHNNEEGLAMLIAAGILAKLLRHKHVEHHVHIPVPVHHDHHDHHEHHGSGSARVPVQHPVHQPAMVPVHPHMVPMQHPMAFQHLYGAASHPVVRRVVYAPRPYPHNPNVMPF